MKKQFQDVFVIVSSVVILNLLYYFWLPFPKSFGLHDGWNLTSDIITNEIYFVIFFSLVLWYINRSILDKTERASHLLRTSGFWGKLFLLLLIENGFLFLNRFIGQNTFYGTDIYYNVSTIVSIFTLWNVAVGKQKKKKLDEDGKALIKWFGLVMAVFFAIVLVFDIVSIMKVDKVFQKYILGGIAKIKILNIRYPATWRNFAIDTLVWSFLATKSKLKATTANTDYTPTAKYLLRLFVFINAITGLWVAKFAILPLNAMPIVDYNWGRGGSYSYVTTLGAHQKSEVAYRIGGRDSTTFPEDNLSMYSFYRNRYELEYHGQEVLEFVKEDYDITEYSEEVIPLTVNGTEVIVWEKAAIYYIKDDEITATYLGDLPTKREDQYFIAAVEEMIRRGYWEFFENGYAYLLNYDPDFIQPYIDRYAAGAFTEEELTVSAEIRTDYRQSFAQEIVNTILARR